MTAGPRRAGRVAAQALEQNGVLIVLQLGGSAQKYARVVISEISAVAQPTGPPFTQALSDLTLRTEPFPPGEFSAELVMRGLSNGESYRDVHEAVGALVRRALNLTPVHRAEYENGECAAYGTG